MSTVNKYWDKYRERHRSESVEKSDVNKLMTDKQAYISFLEVQLERVAQSVLTTQGFSERIESLQIQLLSSDEKIINLTRLVKLQQTYADSQEEEINHIKKSLEAGAEPKITFSLQNSLEKRLQQIEEKIEYSRFREKEGKHEDYIKDLESALKATESKILGLLNKVTEEIEFKHKKHEKKLENSFEELSNELKSKYEELSKKMKHNKDDFDLENKFKRLNAKVSEIEGKQFGKTNFDEDYDKDHTQEGRLDLCERGLKDLEHFLVAIAEEVKKIEEKQLDTSDIEYRISEKLNSKVEKLGELVRKALNIKTDTIKSFSATPEKTSELLTSKESPKFPSVLSSHSKSYQEDKARSKSKESDSSNSRERTSKSPKSVSSRSKKSNSSSRTPKSKKSNSPIRTPKSKKSLSPRVTPSRKKDGISPVGTPKATTKSKAMEVSIKQKIKNMKTKDNEEKKILMKKDEKKKTKKKNDKKSKLDKLYQELSGKS